MKSKYKIAVIGLGYVGLTIAHAFSSTYGKIIGLDTNPKRIAALKKNYDANGDVSPDDLAKTSILYTTDPSQLQKANFYIIAAPTPVDKNKEPDLSALIKATTTLSKYIKKNDIIVYESSVAPGITENICLPILENNSGLKCGKDFGLGFSPERISPGDKVHTFSTIPKIISGVNPSTLNKIAKVYEKVIKAGLYKVSSIKVAEAAKLIENAQRDINISFMNEVAMILHTLGMESTEVIQAASTKWNFAPFKPGLVGGHCIGVSASYLYHKANEAGYNAELIQASRHINESIPIFISEIIIKHLAKLDIPINKARVGILGITYKEDCPDIHDTKVINIINYLREYDINLFVHDPIAGPKIAKNEFKVNLQKWSDLKNLDILAILVAHKQYKKMSPKKLMRPLKKNGLIIDIKGIVNPHDFEKTGIKTWRL